MLKYLFTFSFVSLILTQFHASSIENDTINYIKKKNLVEVLPVEFGFNRIGLSYERVLNEYISLRAPLQISVGDSYNRTIRNSIGTQLLFFPLKHNVVSYFSGISFKVGIIAEPSFYADLYYPYPYQVNKKFLLPELLNGIRINMGQYFSLSSSLGLGFIKIEGYNQMQFKATGNFGMGFKF